MIIGRIPKMCGVLQMVSAPLNLRPIIVEHFRHSHQLASVTQLLNNKQNELLTVKNSNKSLVMKANTMQANHMNTHFASTVVVADHCWTSVTFALGMRV